MDTLPPELLLYFIPFLPLTSLIAARGVNTRWRSFAQTARLHPARKTLLDLYLAAIVHPNFASLVATLRPHVRVFDREAYIADLTSRGCVLPDVFELWVLEWPSKAIHFWAWPGLAGSESHGEKLDHDYYYDLGNALGDTVPIIDTIPVPKKEVVAVGNPTCRSLALLQVYFWFILGVAQLWLVVDANERINDRRAGRLLWTYAYFLDELDGTGSPIPGQKKLLYDTPPFGPPTDFRLVDFLDLLDVSRSQLDEILGGYFFEGVRLTDDDE